MTTIQAHLTKLHYEIGHQWRDISIQQSWPIQSSDGKIDVQWGHKRAVSDALYNNDEFWISNVTNRTLLNNEIVLDLDPHTNETEEDFQQRIEQTISEVKKRCYGSHVTAWTTGNRGVHIHIIDDQLAHYTSHQRAAIRRWYCLHFHAEVKHTDKLPIMMEYSKHRKTGKQKVPL